MDAAYLNAAHPKPFTILGKRLKPFCLGHEILFQRFGNRFSIESKEDPTLEDLLTGVHICSQLYRKDATLDNFSIPIRVRIYAKLMGPSYLRRAYELFADYILAHSEIPDFYTKDDGPKDPVGTPTIQAVKVSLMANLGLSEEEALNTPLSLGFWNHFSWAEAQGAIQIIDDDERAKIAQAKALESKVEEMAKRMFPNGYTPNAGVKDA